MTDDVKTKVVPINPEAELKNALQKITDGRKRGPGRPPNSDLEVRSPLEHMLWVMNNPKADAPRRDKMAIAAARYLHRPKAAELLEGDGGKKDQRQTRANELAAEGTKFAPGKAPTRGAA